MKDLQNKIIKIVEDAHKDANRVFVNLLREDRVSELGVSEIEIADATNDLLERGILAGSVSSDKTLTEVWIEK